MTMGLFTSGTEGNSGPVAHARAESFGQKGYMGTLDLIVAMIVFLAIIYMIIWVGDETQRTVVSFENSQAYKDKAISIADVLLKTRGSPGNWEHISNATNWNVTSIGIASEPNVLDEKKLDMLKAFDGSSYANTTRLLGLTSENYHIELLNIRNHTVYSVGRPGPPLSSIERFAILDGETVRFRFSLY